MPQRNHIKTIGLAREDILKTALQFFYRNGIRDLDEPEFFKGIGISPNEFYSMFRNKDDILEQALRYNMEHEKEINQQLREKAKNSIDELMSILKYGIDIIKDINPLYVTDLINYYPSLMRIGAQHMQDYTLNLYASILNEGIKQGLMRSDINIQIVTRVITENVYVMINYRTFPPEKYHPGEVARSIYLYYFRGLCTAKGAQLVDDFFAANSF
jgi:AcrR family transcriptional regulator